MKPTCGFLMLLCMLTIGLVSSETDQNGNEQSGFLSKNGTSKTQTTTAVPPMSISMEKSDITITSTAAAGALNALVTDNSTTVTPKPTTNVTTPEPSPNTTVTPSTPTTPSTTTVNPNTTTTTKPTTPTPEPTTTTKPTTLHPSTTPNNTTPHPDVTTTPSPITTTAVPPSAPGRHFDNLSFLGGIFLGACLMAAGIYLSKHIKTKYTEGHYRTL